MEYSDILVQYRNTYKSGFIDDPRSPLTKEDLVNLDFYPPQPAWNLACTCTLLEGEKPFDLPTYSGTTRTYIKYAKAKCPYKTQTLELVLYKNIHQPINPLYKNNLFLPFKDWTNDEQTYGGGRYINLKDYDIKNQTIHIDFNKSYNPWCAYSDGYNCPIPPIENHVELAIEAGEKSFKGPKKHKEN